MFSFSDDINGMVGERDAAFRAVVPRVAELPDVGFAEGLQASAGPDFLLRAGHSGLLQVLQHFVRGGEG